MAHFRSEHRVLHSLYPEGESKKRGPIMPRQIGYARFRSGRALHDLGMLSADQAEGTVISRLDLSLRIRAYGSPRRQRFTVAVHHGPVATEARFA